MLQLTEIPPRPKSYDGQLALYALADGWRPCTAGYLDMHFNIFFEHSGHMPDVGKVWGIGLKDSPDLRHGVYLHMLCKYLDYCDTLIIVLRKKSEQLSFLHLWHHATILLVWGWVVNTWPTAAEGGSAAYAYGAWINSINVRYD